MVNAKTGSAWNHEELDLIVADYFFIPTFPLAGTLLNYHSHKGSG